MEDCVFVIYTHHTKMSCFLREDEGKAPSYPWLSSPYAAPKDACDVVFIG